VLLVLVVGAVAARGFGGGDPGQPVSGNLPPATAMVTRATLTQTERVTGMLGYGVPSTVVARASAAAGDGGPGTLTWLAPVGAVVQRGRPVYTVDDRPVVLLIGEKPLWRVLAVDVKGSDVELLETNLRALGYSGFTVDAAFTSATTTAVKRWQKALGLEQTGTVDVNQIAVAAGQLRVVEHKAAAGSEATGEVLTYTGTTRVVTVPLEVTRQHLVRTGLRATVTLPDGRTVTGTVRSIGTVASAGNDDAPGGQPASEPTVQVVVIVADQAALGTLDAAPVQLMLVVAERRDVLTVPVGALVALAEGGYGVQVVEGGATTYVAVEVGMFAGGRVEVSGGDIAEGMTVGVPA